MLFVVFGPRKKGAQKDSAGKWLLRALAVLAPAVLVMDRVGATLGLPAAHRLLLVGASMAATAVSVAILAWINRERRDRRGVQAGSERRESGGGSGARDQVQRR